MALGGWIKGTLCPDEGAAKTDQLILYECRDCGAPLGPDADVCSVCQSTEVDSYEI